MNIARILYPVETLGPGKRVAIWVCGCPIRCEGCANPELWEFDENKNIKISVLLDLIEKIVSENPVDGFTITGGEPFYQSEDLLALLAALSKWSEDILVFTGYYYEQIAKEESLDHIAVLVDGPYIKERNRGLTLRGSDNQTVRILDRRYEDTYNNYLKVEKSRVQNFLEGTSVISVGIHRPDYRQQMSKNLHERGLLEGGIQNK